MKDSARRRRICCNNSNINRQLICSCTSGRGGITRFGFCVVVLAVVCPFAVDRSDAWVISSSFTPQATGYQSTPPSTASEVVAASSSSLLPAAIKKDTRKCRSSSGCTTNNLNMGLGLSLNPLFRKRDESTTSASKRGGTGGTPTSSSDKKRKWTAGMWDKLTAHPPAGRAHDEVTFRSGYEGRTLTIPQAERYSSAAWLHNVRTLPTSVILHRIKQPLLAQTCWATAVSLIHATFGNAWQMSIKPHTLLGSALGLLLVFRTNAAYQRFQEGRKLWEELLNQSRDIARMSYLYEPVFGRKLVLRIANLLACHAVILQEHLQGYKLPQVWRDLVRRDEAIELLRTTCNRPLMIVNKISKEIKSVPYTTDEWTSRERLAILAMCNKLAATIGGCERLVQTPVPLHYVRHTSRFLTIWCFLLPLVIVGEMGMATAPVVCLATWAMFGIQEIGLLIEDPFQTALSLDIMCNTVYSDVMQTINAEDPTLPQQPIPMQAGVAAVDFVPERKQLEDVQPLSARCRHPVLEGDMFGGPQDGMGAVAAAGAGTMNASEVVHGMEH